MTKKIGAATSVADNNATKVASTKVQIIKKDVKHINLKVKPSGEVILTAPTGCNEMRYRVCTQKKGRLDR